MYLNVMELPAGTIALARAIMHLVRRQATGVLNIETSSTQARVTFEHGRICGSDGIRRKDDSLGERLVREGSLNVSAHAAAMMRGRPRGLVGEWLSKQGLVSGPAIAFELRRQLLERLLTLFEHHRLKFDFANGASGLRQLDAGNPLHPAELVLVALRHALHNWIHHPGLITWPPQTIALTALGRELLAPAPLWPEEIVLRSMLVEGAANSTLRAHVSRHVRAFRLLYALERMGGVNMAASSRDCSLLLAKHRQLRKHADPYAMLDLPQGASAGQARVALRRLARRLHPDRLSVAQADLQLICNDVLRGLLHAEEQIRLGATMPHR